MDVDQLRELATNALIGHWPAHFGVNSDQEKIEYLAQQLETAATEIREIRDADELEEKLDDAETAYAETVTELADIESCAECGLCDQHKKAKTQ